MKTNSSLDEAIRQLLNDARQNTLLSIRGDGAIVVGAYIISEENGSFVVVKFDTLEETFVNKKAAVAFAVSKVRGDRARADRILNFDHILNKYKTDLIHYRRGLALAEQKGDSKKEDVMICRIDAALRDMERVKRDLLQEVKNITFA